MDEIDWVSGCFLLLLLFFFWSPLISFRCVGNEWPTHERTSSLPILGQGKRIQGRAEILEWRQSVDDATLFFSFLFFSFYPSSWQQKSKNLTCLSHFFSLAIDRGILLKKMLQMGPISFRKSFFFSRTVFEMERFEIIKKKVKSCAKICARMP